MLASGQTWRFALSTQPDRFRIAQIIAAALMSSVTIYAFVGYVISQGGDGKPMGTAVSIAAMALGLAQVGMGAFVATSPYRSGFLTSGLPEDRRWSAALEEQLIGRVQVRMIIGYALIESAAVVGLLLLILFGATAYSIAGGLMATAFGAMGLALAHLSFRTAGSRFFALNRMYGRLNPPSRLYAANLCHCRDL